MKTLLDFSFKNSNHINHFGSGLLSSNRHFFAIKKYSCFATIIVEKVDPGSNNNQWFRISNSFIQGQKSRLANQVLVDPIECPPPPPLVFCPLLKISLGNPYLKILDGVVNAHIKEKINKFCFTTLFFHQSYKQS